MSLRTRPSRLAERLGWVGESGTVAAADMNGTRTRGLGRVKEYGPSGLRTVGAVSGEEDVQPLVQVVEEAGETAAIHPDGVVDFVPERPVEMAGRNAEIAADIDDDGADG